MDVHCVRVHSRETPADAFIQHCFVHMPYQKPAVGQIRIETDSGTVLQQKVFLPVGVGQDDLVDLCVVFDIAYVEDIGIAVNGGGSDPSQFDLRPCGEMCRTEPAIEVSARPHDAPDTYAVRGVVNVIEVGEPEIVAELMTQNACDVGAEISVLVLCFRDYAALSYKGAVIGGDDPSQYRPHVVSADMIGPDVVGAVAVDVGLLTGPRVDDDEFSEL